MATIESGSMIGGTVFAMNPVIVNAKAGVFPDESAFRQTVLTVSDGRLSRSFRTEVSASGEVVCFDVSSALAGFLQRFEPDVLGFLSNGSAFVYPDVRYSVSVHDEYLLGGELVITEDQVSAEAGNAIMGGLSEIERMSSSPDVEVSMRGSDFSRKPSEGEVFILGMPYLVSGFSDGAAFTRKVSLVSGMNTVSGRKVYADGDARLLETRFCIAFMNPQGVLETVCAFGKGKESADAGAERFNMFGEPSYRPSRSIVSKPSRHYQKFSLSSGLVSREWMRWWAYQFGVSARYWVFVGGIWVPCIVEPSQPEVFNQEKQDMESYDFDVTIALDGFVGV